MARRPALHRTAALLLPPLLLLVPLLAAGCERAAPEEPPLRVDAAGERAARTLVAEAVSEGLTARDARGQVVPGLAQSWRVSDDGLSIVFRLRPAQFADGTPVTAADAVRSMERARAGRAGPLARDLLQGVTAVSAPVETVVELRLSTPQPELLELLATPMLAIRAGGRRATAGAFLVEGNGAAEDRAAGDKLAAAGQPAEPVRLVPNPRFHGAERVALRAATVTVQRPEEAVRRFNMGEADMVLGGGLDGLGAARVTARRETLLLEQPRAALLLLVNQRNEALADARVRRALLLAIDREALGQTLFGSAAAVPLFGVTPATLGGRSTQPPEWAARPFVARQESARQLLAEAGFDAALGGGRRLVLQVAITDAAGDTRLMERVGADLAAVGVDLKLARRAPEAHAEAVRAGRFDLALVQRETPVDSPLPFLQPLRCGRNAHGVCLADADRLLAESWSAPTRASRLAMLAEAEQMWVEDGAAIGLVQPLGWSLVSPRISGFAANPTGSHALRHLSLEPERRLLK
jgi:ABC-type transport system substrate-binding protein